MNPKALRARGFALGKERLKVPRVNYTGSPVSEKNPSQQLGEYRGRLLSGSRPKHLIEKAKIVHLAHVLGFASVHYLAVE